MASNNIEKTEVSRIFIKFKKNRPWILTEFGASLQSLAGPEGEHSLVELDSSGLAWEAGFRNDDVIEAIDITSFKVKGVSHRSLLDYLREEGQACNMLIRRDRKEKPSTYTWIAFLIKENSRSGGKPVVAKKATRRVGTDIDQAEDVHKTLPKWALIRTPNSVSVYTYNTTQEIRLVDGEGDEKDYILGFFIQLGVSRAAFTTNDFSLKMHSYENIHSLSNGSVLAFSAKLRRIHTERTSSCFDLICRKTDDMNDDDNSDSNDDTDYDERNDASNNNNEFFICGNEEGPLNLTHAQDFPSYMTGGARIIGNSKMFISKINPDGSSFLSPINTGKELYMCNSHDVHSQAALRARRKYMLYIRPVNV